MSKKKVLLVSQNFYPEFFKSNDIAFELVKKGFEVDVLTGIPNYPQGEYYKGYGLFKKRIETVNGVKIYRVFQFPRGKKGGNLGLSLNYVSFMISGVFWALYLSIFKSYDSVLIHLVSPITQAIPAIVIKIFRKTPIYSWVLDIWPDSAVLGGGINNRSIIGILDCIVKFTYNKSDKILISSKSFKDLILQKGEYKDKIVYFPNWSEDLLNMPKVEIPALPDGFIIMMAGNLGVAQTLDAVMNAALELKDNDNIKWVLIGDGSRKQWVEEFVKKHSLENSVYIMGRYPFEMMPSFYKNANAMLLTLKADYPHINAVVPARLQSYMAASRPVLAMASGASADVIKESDCGYVVDPEDYKSLVSIIKEKVLTDKLGFELKGANGRKFFEKHYRKEKCLSNLVDIIKNNN